MINSILSEIFRDFVSLIFPNYCLACHNSLVKGENLICTRCLLEMPTTNYHVDNSNPLKGRLSSRMDIAYAMAFLKFSKSGKVQKLLHALKYKNQPELGVMLGTIYGERIKETNIHLADLIVPVPLHPIRKSKRGYNQSVKFAEGLSQSMCVPYTDELLVRKIMTETQTRKTKLNRWQNVTEVFQLKDAAPIKDKNILLVDDVVTTGATLEACSMHLIQAGCNSLSIACIAEA
jgi:ComF family protein